MESNNLTNLSVDIPNYSGPLEVLLDLAKKQKVDLVNISITKLADQFLKFIKNQKELNLENASEFLLMATWLAYLKSKLLLPDDEEDDFKALEVAEKLKLQLKKLELIRILSDQMLKKKRLGVHIFTRGMKGGIRSINTPVYDVTLYELLKTYSLIQMQKTFQNISIPKLPVFTTEEGIKQIKNNLDKITDWKHIVELIPKFYIDNKMNRTGIAGIFAASLELTKEGVVSVFQKQSFDKLLIKKKANIIDFPTSPTKLERQVEAILFAASEPLDVETIEKRLQTSINLNKVLENLQEIYKKRGINLVCIKSKWSFRTASDLSKLMALQKSTQKKLSKATIETLSIIVYHQPVTRSEIEEIRGVSFASNTLETLLELDWVRPSGRKEVPGKPIQYATTENFLNHFNIQKLSDLPTIEELGSAGLIDTSTIDKSIFGTGKFFKEQSISEKQNIYEDIDEAIKKAPDEEK